MENRKWGLYFPFLFFLYTASFFFFLPEGLVSLGGEKRKKQTAEEGEIVQNSVGQRTRRSQKVISFLKGCQAMSEAEKRRDKSRKEECGGVKSVYLPKESDSCLPANNPFLVLHIPPTPKPLLHILSFTLFPSFSPGACLQKRPCQFTVTLHHLFSLFLIFLF